MGAAAGGSPAPLLDWPPWFGGTHAVLAQLWPFAVTFILLSGEQPVIYTSRPNARTATGMLKLKKPCPGACAGAPRVPDSLPGVLAAQLLGAGCSKAVLALTPLPHGYPCCCVPTSVLRQRKRRREEPCT